MLSSFVDGESISMAGPVILLVDDELLIHEVLGAELADAGFEIVLASDGAQALAELDTDATRFRAVVTDIKLGAGPDGWDVGRRARELVSDIPVVYTTGTAFDDWSSKGVPNSVVITKPFAPAKITMAVAAMITAADTNRAG
jgi:DNA-binding response OmpR family regulator